MRNKTLLSIGLAAVLAVPIGASVAAAEDAPDSTPATVVAAEQDRDQVRDCDLFDGEGRMGRVGDRDQVRECDLNDGQHLRTRDRDRDNGTGEGFQNGNGPMNVGSADGNANRFGRGAS